MLSFNSDSIKIDIVGRWTGEDQGVVGFMIFDSEGYASMEFSGKVMGGKSFLMNGENAKMTYTFNSDKDPAELDMIVSNEDGKIIRAIYCIAEFKNKNNMKLAASFGSPTRPAEFTEKNTMNLTRIE